ncbi:MOSC N-terminal beta barrel domain-containing protein [Shewanella cyperi]|uniref:MOSC N-terminal beta barrel domain-containing protein n=1 Tax=Shewanella cyperi TaxID=2814292 RepID=UPI001A94333C|nr:MOSC N-terminal beta barrel domain-containing protein [Shewanella cyperi]QSX39978.1 MOSC domain-containing protein [Shewanella cyperi]
MASLSSIHIYPVKSIRGQTLPEARVAEEGLIGDRRFMVCGLDGRFFTARTHPSLSLIHSEYVSPQAVHAGALELHFDDMPPLRLEPDRFASAPFATGVWKDNFSALTTTEEADAWISAVLGEPAKLLWLGEQSARFRQQTGGRVSFADGYPLLLISQASLEDLNSRSDRLNRMAQFRPNLVIEGVDAFAEDSWDRIRIGEVEFKVAKPCGRCVMTTLEQDSTEFHPLKEPLDTLSRYRRSGNGDVDFGQNLIPLNEGSIRAGDSLTVLSYKEPQHYADGAAPKRRLRLVSKDTLAADFVSLHLQAEDGKPLPNFIAGQHLKLAFDIEGTRHIRRYSLSASPLEPLWRISVKRAAGGVMSNIIHDRLQPGDVLLADLPSGKFRLRSGKAPLFISAGSGITPMLSMARTLMQQDKFDDGKRLAAARFIHLCRTEADVPEAELAHLTGAGMPLMLLLSQPGDDWPGLRGRLDRHHLQGIEDLLERDVYLCGPAPFMAEIEQVLLSLGLAADQIQQELFGKPGRKPKQAPKQVRIQIGEQVFTGDNQRPILDQAEQQGLSMPWSCRAGICSACRHQLLEGEVYQPKAPALSAAERAEGKILACCAIPLGDIKLTV